MNQQKYINVSFSILIILMCFFKLQILPAELVGNVSGDEINILIPALFLILGASLNQENCYKEKESVFVKYCAKQYLLYYFIFAVIGLCLRQIGVWTKIGDVRQEGMKEAFLGVISLNGSNLLWIFPVIFVVLVSYGLMRKSLPLIACVGISIALCVLSFFAKGIWGLANSEESDIKLFFITLSMVLWRGCNLIGFVAIGDALDQLLSRLERKKLIVGIVGLVLCIGGFILMRYSGESLIAPESLKYGKLYVSMPTMLFMACGILMLAKWIGEFGIVEIIGRNWRLFILTVSNLLFLNAVNIVGNDVFQASDNNFLTAITRIVLLFVLELAFMLFWELQIMRLFSKKVLIKENMDKVIEE